MADVRTEPSMDEILASIKRIIADDGVALSGSRARPRNEPADPRETVLELTDPVFAPAPPALTLVASTPPAAPPPAAAPPSPAASVSTQAPINEAVAAPAPAEATQPVPPAAERAAPSAPPAAGAAPLVSEGAACASRQSLSALSSMVLRTPESDNTLDGLVRELLRPLLKEWLDARLPDLVETLVAREIARITGKAT